MAGDERVEQGKEGASGPGSYSSVAGAVAEEKHIASESDEEEDEPTPGPAAAPGQDESGHGKANTLNRVIARFIDILFTLLLAKLPGYIGFLSGITYIGIADGLMGGRSIGKRIIGLRVLLSHSGRKADFRASILRNSTMGLLFLLFQVPFVGWALALLGLGFESLLIIGSPEGKRLGDEIADTVVVDETT